MASRIQESTLETAISVVSELARFLSGEWVTKGKLETGTVFFRPATGGK